MTFGTSIQTYDGTHANHDNGAVNCAVDWANSRIWMSGTVTAVSYISRYGIVTGAEQASATANSIISGLAIPAIGWDTDGYVYGTGPNALGAGGITRANGTTLALRSNSPYTAPNFGGTNIVSLKIGISQYVLDTNVGNNVINLNNTSLSVDGTYLTSFGWGPGDSRSAICMGKAGSIYGYLLTSPNSSGPCHLYRINLPAATSTLIHTYNSTDVDPGLTDLFFAGLCIDQTDGNILASCFGNGGASKNYIVKLNASTGAIIWTCPLGTTSLDSALGGPQMSQSRILNQRLAIITQTPVKTITIINTATGAVVSTQTTGLNGLTVWGAQSFDDVSGAIIGLFDLTITAGGPTPLNGSAGAFRGWAALYVMTAQATAGVPNGPATSRKRAWTFTLDGHVFYVLDLGQEGTWLYDVSTGEWSNFYTNTYVQWNVASGCMWGNRIVGGDLSSSNVYEVAASNLQDNGSADIPHCVTGGLETRSRARFGCDDVLLSVSLGDLDNVAGSAMNLRFSDDNGQTWSAYYPITMVEGDYVAELRWRSLGSFGAPGRVFEFSDLGGPRSIDGCDAFVEGFDSEKSSAEG
jgi:hypothetical protein